MSDTQDTEAITQETPEEYERRVIAAFNPESAIGYTPIKFITMPKANGVNGLARAITPDGKWLVSGHPDGTVRLWDVESQRCLRTFTGGHSSLVFALAITPNGKTIISGDLEGTVRLWNVENGEFRNIRTGYPNSIHALDITPDGKVLVSGDDTGRISLIIPISKDGCFRETRKKDHGIRALAINLDGKTIAYSSGDDTIRLEGVGSGEFIRTFTGHAFIINMLAFSSDGKMLVSGSMDKTIRVWNVENGACIRTDTLPLSSMIRALAFSQNGDQIIANVDSGDENKTVLVSCDDFPYREYDDNK